MCLQSSHYAYVDSDM